MTAQGSGTLTTVPYGTPNTYQQWAEDLITYADQLGGKLPNTGAEVSVISAWEQSENPVSQIGKGYFNPLNATLKTAGGTQLSNGTEPGSSFVPTYPSVINGLVATWDELNQGPSDAPGNYAPELSALENQSGSQLVTALGTKGSVWGSSPSLVSQILGQGASTASNNEGGASPVTGSATAPAASSGGTAAASGTPANATLTGLDLNPLNGFGIPGVIAGGAEDALGSVLGPVITAVENFGLVLMGIVLIVVALIVLSKTSMDSIREHGNEQEAKAEPDVQVTDEGKSKSSGSSNSGQAAAGGGGGAAGASLEEAPEALLA